MFGRQGFFGGTLTLGVFRGLAQTLGFIQFVYFLHVYGSTIRVDALFIAQTVPFLFTHFFGQPVTLLFVPVFLHLSHQEGDEESWRFASSLIILTALLLCTLTAVVILLAPAIVLVLAPGFSPDERLLAAGLLQWMSALIVINGLAGSARSLYFAHQSYTVPGIASVVPSVGIIAGIFFLSNQLGIYAYVVGGIAGALAQLLILWTLLNYGERRLRFRLTCWHKSLKEYFALLGPRFFVLGLSNVNGAVDRAFASGLGPASVSAMSYAITIADTPTTWLRTTLGGTVVPVLSEDAARQDYDSFQRQVQRFLRISLFAIVPCTVLLMVLPGPMIQTLFQRGKFDAHGAELMAIATFYYAISLLPFTAAGVLAGSFFALKDTMSPFKVSCGLVLLNVGLNYLLVGSMGLGGLALATSLVALAQAVVLLAMLRTHLGRFSLRQTYQSMIRTALSGGLMAIVLIVVGRSLDVFAPPTGTFLQEVIPLGLTAGLGGLTYLLASWFFGVDVAHRAVARINRRLARRDSSRLSKPVPAPSAPTADIPPTGDLDQQ